MKDGQRKIQFCGIVRTVQVRSDVWRYLVDNRTHSHTGYNVFLEGTADGEERRFCVAISERQQKKCHIHTGDKVSGTAWTKLYPNREYADYYRAGALKMLERGSEPDEDTREPWTGEVEPLRVYAERQCRMLDKRRYNSKCCSCKWAAMANVTIEYDFGRSQRFRFESFCYGPKSCKLYTMGRPRAVPYKGMNGVFDEGWLDEDMTAHRGWDE
ncbi:MAG: hypothetical protein IKG18_14245 [Atopobiaceae bacterium]|nr:hypothetical protein [Atopobiaceae bacterium]